MARQHKARREFGGRRDDLGIDAQALQFLKLAAHHLGVGKAPHVDGPAQAAADLAALPLHARDACAFKRALGLIEGDFAERPRLDAGLGLASGRADGARCRQGGVGSGRGVGGLGREHADEFGPHLRGKARGLTFTMHRGLGHWGEPTARPGEEQDIGEQQQDDYEALHLAHLKR